LEIVRDGETGLLYPPGDIPALADAIAQLLADPELRTRLGERGHAIAASTYDLDSYGNGILRALANARGQPNPAAGMAGYLRALNRYTARAIPWAELLRERIARPMRRIFKCF
jgi:hypothetical protein